MQYLIANKKILGMNSRNLRYTRPCNPKRARRIADDKLFSKRVLKRKGLPVPQLIATISSFEELQRFDWEKLPSSFALKPVHGFSGGGIIVVFGKKKDGSGWIKADGSIFSTNDIKTHVGNILDGNFSLAGTPDTAFFEERLKLLKLFKPYTFKGIPDIRVIVYNKVPVIAMLRLPTKESGGKANLFQGAIGVGIDMATGVTTTAIQGKGKLIEYVPNTRLLLSGIKIPYWGEILHLAVRAQEASHLGFLGADVAIDKERGPVFVELNARPGLSIQIANMTGLKDRLERVRGLKIKTIERGVRVGMDLFGGEIEEEVEDISGKKVIGAVEKVKLTGKDGKEVELEAKIDTGAYSSSIDSNLAKELGYGNLLTFFNSLDLPKDFSREEAKKIEEELRKKYLGKQSDLADISVIYSSHGVSIRPEINLFFTLGGISVSAHVNVAERKELEKDMIIGRKSLRRFLIDVNK